MPSDDRNIIYAILDTLQADPQLAAVVKKFTAGAGQVSRKISPWINVGALNCRVSEKTLGRRGYDGFE